MSGEAFYGLLWAALAFGTIAAAWWADRPAGGPVADVATAGETLTTGDCQRFDGLRDAG